MCPLRFSLLALLLTISSGYAFAAEPPELEKLRHDAEQGDAEAQFDLGIAYSEGKGVPRDSTEAVKWFRKAADQGLAEAQSNLGAMYYKGEGVPRDDAEAIKWFRKAADQGNAFGQSALALMYYKGKGVPRDFVTSYMWISLAATNGDKDRQGFLDQLEKKMTQAQVAEGQKLAREWMTAHAK